MAHDLLTAAQIADLLPYQAAEMLKNVSTIFPGSISVNEAVQLQKLERALRAKAGSTLEG